MDFEGNNQQRLTGIGATGHTARWAPDGNWIFFTSMWPGDREIWAVTANGGDPVRVTELPSQDAHGLWSPQGDFVLYLSDHHVMWVQPFDGGERIHLFEPGDRIDYTHLSADGTRLLFTRERVEADIWLMEQAHDWRPGPRHFLDRDAPNVEVAASAVLTTIISGI